MLKHRLRQIQRAFDIDFLSQIPVFFGHVADSFVDHNTGHIGQNIYPSIFGNDALNKLHAFVLICNIDFKCHNRTAELFGISNGFFQALCGHIHRSDVDTLAKEASATSRPMTPPAPVTNATLPLANIFHSTFPIISSES